MPLTSIFNRRLRFECCEGFERLEGEDGCTRVKPLMNLLETAESLGATKWAQYIRESGLAAELESAGAFTLFAPTNDAFDNLRRSLRSQMESYRGNPNNPILLYHILPTKLQSDEFLANTLAETRHQGHSIRINKYSNGMTTINCALLVRKDQQAVNGVVHLIDSVLDPNVGILQNVADMVLNDGRFSVLAEILEKSGYINVLRTLQESITILAPSDEAFQKLPESRREKIINDREARLALLQNHVIPHVICESAITGKHRVRTISNNKLTFNCDIEGAYVETTKLRGNFNLGKNGIIHMIDDVLLPDRAKNLIELAQSRKLFTFVELVKKAGLEETLSHTGDYTFFVPDEAAWYALDSDVLSDARRDMDMAGQLVRFHGAYGRHLTNAITDNQAIMSLDEENPVRLQVWRRALGVEDARITEKDIEAQNGVIHIINKVIVPSNQSAFDILRSVQGQNFEIFLEALERVSAIPNGILNLGPGDESFYTFFVPTDDAFKSLDRSTLDKIKTDDQYTIDFLKSHIAVNMFPETSFQKNLVYSINGMAGPFDVKKRDDGVLTVNNEVVTSSHMSADGVIHVIDKVFLPGTSYTYSTTRKVTTTYSRRGGKNGSSNSSSSSSSSSSYSSRSSSRRSYKKTVTYGGSQGGTEGQVSTYPEGTVSSASASSRKISTGSSRRRNTLSSSGVIRTRTKTSSIDNRRNDGASDKDTTALEETRLQGSGFLTRESEGSLNAISSASDSKQDLYDVPEVNEPTEPGLKGSSGSESSTHSITYHTYTPIDNSQGTYTIREGSYSSDSYPSSLSSSSSSSSSKYWTKVYEETQGEDIENPHRGDFDLSHDSSSSVSSSVSHPSASNSRGSPLHGSRFKTFSSSGSASGSSDVNVSGGSATSGSEAGSHHDSESSSYITEGIGSGYSQGLGSGNGLSNSHRSASSSSRTYTYQQSSDSGGSLTHDGTTKFNLPSDIGSGTYTVTNTTIYRKNTVGPVSPGGGRFSYVGHSYGQDVVGHTDNIAFEVGQGGNVDVERAPLPFSAGRTRYNSVQGSSAQGTGGVKGNTYEYSQTSHIKEVGPFTDNSKLEKEGVSSSHNGISSSTRTSSKRNYGVTRTVVTYPAGGKDPLYTRKKTYKFPADGKSETKFSRSGKEPSSSVSAYAFTDDMDFADGADFAEATSGGQYRTSRYRVTRKS
ncbi:hypothetical protein SK128_013712 [Halocaridina rubra]|uniref:FAS1 domain-containing protein n=1 Tax=Halocaridina rubra TaxID=373956 RepID=A0AAN8WS10_HALRR